MQAKQETVKASSNSRRQGSKERLTDIPDVNAMALIAPGLFLDYVPVTGRPNEWSGILRPVRCDGPGCRPRPGFSHGHFLCRTVGHLSQSGERFFLLFRRGRLLEKGKSSHGSIPHRQVRRRLDSHLYYWIYRYHGAFSRL